MNTLVTRIVKIGNSQGIRIPKTLLEQLNFSEQVLLEALPNGDLMVRPVHAPRAGWAAAFAEMAANGDDTLLLDPGTTLSSFDLEEWEW